MSTNRPATLADGRASDHAPARRWRALYVLAMLQTVIVMDGTMVNVAVPAMQRDLGLATGELSWVIDGYLLAGGGLLLFGGRVADVLGRRRTLLAGAAVFGISSLLAGLATVPGVLLAARFAQGVGEAFTLPAALSVIALLFRDTAERRRAMGLWGAVTGAAATAGGAFSGVVTDLVSWRLVFFVNVPVVAAALLLVSRLIPDSRGPRHSVDLPGAITGVAGLLALMEGLLSAADHAWTARPVLVPLLVGLVALGAFLLIEARRAEPLVPLQLLRDPTRVLANLVSVCVMGVMSTMFLLGTLHLARVAGFSPLQIGLAVLPSGGAFVLGTSLARRVAASRGLRAALVWSAAVAAVGMALLAVTVVRGDYLTGLLPGFFVASLGIGAAHPGLQTAALHGVSSDDAGLASGVQVSVQSLSKALGIAVLVPLAARVADTATAHGSSPAAAELAGERLAFAVAAAVLASGAVLARTLPAPGMRADQQ